MKKTIIRVSVLLIVLCLLSLCSCSVNINLGQSLTTIHYRNYDKYTAGNMSWGDPVKTIEVHWIAGSVILQEGDVANVMVEESYPSEIEEKWQVHTWLEEETLHIQYAANGEYQFKNLQKDLIVTVPTGTVLESCIVEKVSGTLYIMIPSDNVSVDSVSGQTVVHNCTNLTVDKASGELDVYNDFIDHLKVDSVSGSVEVRCKSFDHLEFDTVSGEVYVQFEELSGITADTNAISTKLDTSLDFIKVSDDGDWKWGDGKARIVLDSISSTLKIEQVKYDSDN